MVWNRASFYMVTGRPAGFGYTFMKMSPVLACIAAFQTFEVAFIGTKGGPAYATWLYGLHIYRTSFEFFEMGYGSTLAWIMFIVLAAFTYFQFRFSKSWVYYAGEER